MKWYVESRTVTGILENYCNVHHAVRYESGSLQIGQRCLLPGLEADERIERILTTVNSQDDLLEAAKAASAELDGLAKVFEHGWKVDEDIYAECARKTIGKLQAAIAKAESKEARKDPKHIG